MRSNVVIVMVIAVGTVAGVAGAADRAVKEYLAGNMAEAAKLLASEIAAGDARASRYLLLGRVHFRQGKWEGAKRALALLLKKEPDNPQGRELLGRVLLRLRRFDEALPYYEECVGHTGRSELRLEMAEVLIGLGREREAVASLKKVIAGARPWPRAHYLLGCIRLESGLGHWASLQFWTALRLKYRSADLRMKLARAYSMEGKATGPLKLVGPLADAHVGILTPDYVVIRPADHGPTNFWYVSGRESAVYQIEHVLAEKKTAASATARILAARCWLMAGDADRAEKHLAPVRPKSSDVFELRAKAALTKHDIRSFNKLLAAYPAKARPQTETLVRYLLDACTVAQMKGSPKEALAFAEQADRILPGRSEVLRALVQLLIENGRRKEAGSKMRLLAELHPDSPEVRLLASQHDVDMTAMEDQGRPFFEEGDDMGETGGRR